MGKTPSSKRVRVLVVQREHENGMYRVAIPSGAVIDIDAGLAAELLALGAAEEAPGAKLTPLAEAEA